MHDATLVVAKLDRLSRNAAFLLTIRDSSVDFVAADMPQANRLTVGILSMVAEQEAEAVSSRTKAALAAAKRRGVRLGNPDHLNDAARRLGTDASSVVRRAKADQRISDLRRIVTELRTEGATSLRALAMALNNSGISASRGGPWSAAQIPRLLARMNA